MPVNFPSTTNGNASGPNVTSQNVTYINQPSTVVSFEIDCANVVGDSTEKWNFILNGTPTGDSVTVVNGTQRGVTTGLSIALAAGDYISWQNDAGASGLAGRQMITTYLTTP
jgi:hypothetical protein